MRVEGLQLAGVGRRDRLRADHDRVGDDDAGGGLLQERLVEEQRQVQRQAGAVQVRRSLAAFSKTFGSEAEWLVLESDMCARKGCKGESAKTEQDKCERSNKCAWVEDGDVDLDCALEETDVPTTRPAAATATATRPTTSARRRLRSPSARRMAAAGW